MNDYYQGIKLKLPRSKQSPQRSMSCINKRAVFFLQTRPNARKPSNFPTNGAGVPLRITRLFPMKLKDVSIEALEETKRTSDVVCLTEMMSLFDCFEKNEFDRAPCQQHVQALQNCYSGFVTHKRDIKTQRMLKEKKGKK